MARESKTAKSESLTIRLDPKTRFILEYLSRLRGQTITTVVERAIVSAASDEKITTPDEYGPVGWQDLWDVSDGVRALRLYAIAAFFPTYEEEKRLAFTREHWPFFYATRSKLVPLNHFVDILWPRIDEYIQIHDDNKASGGDWFGAGKVMQEQLRKSNLKAPDWPVKESLKEPPKPSSQAASGSNFSRDLDDDIPF